MTKRKELERLAEIAEQLLEIEATSEKSMTERAVMIRHKAVTLAEKTLELVRKLMKEKNYGP